MRAIIYLGFICFSIAIFFSCSGFSQKTRDVNRLEKTVKETEKNYKSYSEEEWSKIDHEIDSLSLKINSDKEGFTQEQLEKANNLIGKYQALKIKSGLNSLKGTLKNWGQQVEGAIKELSDSTH